MFILEKSNGQAKHCRKLPLCRCEFIQEYARIAPQLLLWREKDGESNKRKSITNNEITTQFAVVNCRGLVTGCDAVKLIYRTDCTALPY